MGLSTTAATLEKRVREMVAMMNDKNLIGEKIELFSVILSQFLQLRQE